MSTMLPEDLQLSNEYALSKKFINRYIRLEIEESAVLMEKVEQGVGLLEEWLETPWTYQSKIDRLAPLQSMELDGVVKTVFVAAAYAQTVEMLSTVAISLCNMLGFKEHRDGVVTASELLAVLCETDVYDIFKAGGKGTWSIQSNQELSERLLKFVENSRYLPPMVIAPQVLTNNFQSPYLTFEDCVILKKHNQHNECASLDVINTRNGVPLTLDYDFVRTHEEVPSKPINDPETMEAWVKFKKDSLRMYLMMIKQGNRFYLHNKYDKRGRMYCQGYHITVQGSPYKKASVDLADKELVAGVPDKYKL